jgi:release factor glutamine methyltransferase
VGWPLGAQATITDRLRQAGCVAAEEEAEELVAASADAAQLEALVVRRERGEPLAWLTGTTRFCGQPLHVDPGVYVPRAQSEDLARRAVSLLTDRRARAADLCTGTGAIAHHLAGAAPNALVVGVDVDRRAAACARRNGVTAVVGDLGRPLRSRTFDVVTGVAPYVPTGELRLLPRDVRRYEPRRALDGGGDGLEIVRRLVACAARLLRPGGWLLLEVGGHQDRGLAPTLAAHGFDDVRTWRDEDGDLRGLRTRLVHVATH